MVSGVEFHVCISRDYDRCTNSNAIVYGLRCVSDLIGFKERILLKVDILSVYQDQMFNVLSVEFFKIEKQ